jgi:hypothetical protein
MEAIGPAAHRAGTSILMYCDLAEARIALGEGADIG